MINAKTELLEHVEDKEVEFVSVAYRRSYYDEPTRIKGQMYQVLPLLDFNYDRGYGRQELYGFIWYTDGTWSERGEYDGAEWWEHKEAPDQKADIDV